MKNRKNISLIAVSLIAVSLIGCGKKQRDFTKEAEELFSLTSTTLSVSELDLKAKQIFDDETYELYSSKLRELNEINIEEVYMKDFEEFSSNKHKAETVGAIDSNGQAIKYSLDDLNIFTRDVEKLKRELPSSRKDILDYMDRIPLITAPSEEEKEDGANIWLDGTISMDGNDILIGMSQKKFNSATDTELREYALRYIELDDTYSETIVSYTDTYKSEFERMQKKRQEALVEDFENPITSPYITTNKDGEHVIDLELLKESNGDLGKTLKVDIFNRKETVDIPDLRRGYTEYKLESQEKDGTAFKLNLIEGNEAEAVEVTVTNDNRLSMKDDVIDTLLK